MSRANLVLPKRRPAVTSVKSAITCNSGTASSVVKKNSIGPNLLKRLLALGVIGRMADKLKSKKQENKGSRKTMGGPCRRSATDPTQDVATSGLVAKYGPDFFLEAFLFAFFLDFGDQCPRRQRGFVGAFFNFDDQFSTRRQCLLCFPELLLGFGS